MSWSARSRTLDSCTSHPSAFGSLTTSQSLSLSLQAAVSLWYIGTTSYRLGRVSAHAFSIALSKRPKIDTTDANKFLSTAYSFCYSFSIITIIYNLYMTKWLFSTNRKLRKNNPFSHILCEDKSWIWIGILFFTFKKIVLFPLPLELCPRPRWGSLERSFRPSGWI